MSKRIETLIVGGGISGLACARTLHDAGRSFLLITDRLGGRMYHSADASMNFGATYINADYRHVSRYVGRGLPFRLRGACGSPPGGHSPLLHWRNLGRFGALARLIARLRWLRRQLRAFRKASERMPQSQLARRFPLIDRYRRQPAEELIAELRLDRLHDDYLALAFQATCFKTAQQANALFYLGTLFPIVVPTWVADFSNTYDKLTRGYRDKILIDRVQSLRRRRDGLWEAGVSEGRVPPAVNVVLAAPAHNIASLYPLPRIGQAAPAGILYVRGQRRQPFWGKRFLLLRPEENGAGLIWRQRGGRDLVFSPNRRPNLDALYSNPNVVARVWWKTAVVLSGADWAPLALEPGLYLAGDHNLCGLEDSFLTGRCAAHHVLRSLRGKA